MVLTKERVHPDIRKPETQVFIITTDWHLLNFTIIIISVLCDVKIISGKIYLMKEGFFIILSYHV